MAQIAPALPLPGGGHMRMQPVYVEDVASAILAGLDRKMGLAGLISKNSPKDVFMNLAGLMSLAFAS